MPASAAIKSVLGMSLSAGPRTKEMPRPSCAEAASMSSPSPSISRAEITALNARLLSTPDAPSTTTCTLRCNKTNLISHLVLVPSIPGHVSLTRRCPSTYLDMLPFAIQWKWKSNVRVSPQLFPSDPETACAMDPGLGLEPDGTVATHARQENTQNPISAQDLSAPDASI